MGKMRKAMEQAKQAMAEKERLKGLSSDELAMYGGKVLDETFLMKRIRLYEKGFVRVTVAPLGGGEFEKLRKVSGEANVQSKTGVGRFVAGVLTAGNNILVTGNKRGGIYLTIVTDKKTHSLHADASIVGPDSVIKAMHKIVTTAESLIQIESGQSVGPSPVAAGPEGAAPASSLADEIQKLNSLLTQGLINDEEFAQAKAKLLS